MDAKSVWPGYEYAHTWNPGRGVEYYRNANRILAVAVFDKKLPGNNKATTFVKVQFLHPETGEPIQVRAPWNYDYGYGILDEVRARELFMRWDEYVDETEHRNAEQKKREETAMAARAEQDRIWRERQEAREREERERMARIAAEREERERVANAEKKAILSKLVIKGLAVSEVEINNGSVTIPTHVVKQWLGVP